MRRNILFGIFFLMILICACVPFFFAFANFSWLSFPAWVWFLIALHLIFVFGLWRFSKNSAE